MVRVLITTVGMHKEKKVSEYEMKIKTVMEITDSVVSAFRKGHLSAKEVGDITDILDEYTDLIEETA